MRVGIKKANGRFKNCFIRYIITPPVFVSFIPLDFIATIKDLLEKGEYGTFHITNAEVATRFNLASAMAAHVKPDVAVRAVDRSFFASGATLPTNESIVSSRCVLRPWQGALAEYLDEEWNSDDALYTNEV